MAKIEINKENWKSGEYRSLDCCSTQRKYYNAVHRFVERYGEPIDEDVIVYRSTTEYESSHSLGCSWNPSLDNCIDFANTAYNGHCCKVYAMVIKKGTKVVKYAVEKGKGADYLESEYVVDMKSLNLIGNAFVNKLSRMYDHNLQLIRYDMDVYGELSKEQRMGFDII